MPLNKSKGNMYDWLTHTFNPVRGCGYSCKYCYVKHLAKRYNYSLKPRIVEKEFRTHLGEGNYIFVGSTSDMFGCFIPDEWIVRVLDYCKKFNNKYLFQSKNPKRFLDFIDFFPKSYVLATTLESDFDHIVGRAPPPEERAKYLSKIKGEKMVSIEPVLAFDLKKFVKMIRKVNPGFVTIGADSKKSNLPEPKPSDVLGLIKELKKFTNVKIKSNLKRLVPEGLKN